MKQPEFIDIHVHTRVIPGFPRNGKQAYATPGQLLERYDEIGVEKAVLLPGVSPECSYVPQSNEEILAVCEAHPDRFIPFCNVDPRAISNSPDAPLEEILSFYREKGCKGIGEVTANLPVEDPLVQNLMHAAEKVGMPLTFHLAYKLGGIYGLYDMSGLPGLEKSLERFSNLKFFGHSQVFWAEMAVLKTEEERQGYPKGLIDQEGAVPKLFRKYPNLYGDLSAGSGHNALARDPEYAIRFLNEFQDQLLFGTDICAPDTPAPLAPFLRELRDSGRITNKVFAKVARENAVRLLSL